MALSRIAPAMSSASAMRPVERNPCARRIFSNFSAVEEETVVGKVMVVVRSLVLMRKVRAESERMEVDAVSGRV